MNLFEGADPEVVGDAQKSLQMDATSWQSLAYLAVCGVATLQEELNTEDVWALLESRQYEDRLAHLQAPDTHAMGQVMVRARREGIIAPTERFVFAQRRDRHKGPMRVWRSLIRGRA